MLGSDFEALAQVIQIRFYPGPHGPSIRGKDVRRALNEIFQPGVVATGGSWHDTYDPYGQLYKNLVGDAKREHLMAARSLSRVLDICFGGQKTADIIGDSYQGEEKPIQTVPGLLEIGPSTIEVIDPSDFSFDHCPRSFTVAMTHASHVRDTRTDEQKRAFPDAFVPLARSKLTGLPVAWKTYKGRGRAILWHPELDIVSADGLLSPDVTLITDELEREHKNGIERTFCMSLDTIKRNWAHALPSDKNPGLKANSGRLIIANVLSGLADDLENALAA